LLFAGFFLEGKNRAKNRKKQALPLRAGGREERKAVRKAE